MATEKIYRGYVKQGRGYAVPEMSAPGILEDFHRLTGLSVIPGTLNIELTEPIDQSRLRYVSFSGMDWDFNPAVQGIVFEGERGVYYGRVTVAGTYPACILFFTWVSNVRTSGELVSPHHFRTILGLNDGDIVEISLDQQI